jgi:teichuronic acid biosynthesis glycosyltransferase TuaC
MALAQGLVEVLDQEWDAALIASRHRRSWADVAEDLEAALQRTLTLRS